MQDSLFSTLGSLQIYIQLNLYLTQGLSLRCYHFFWQENLSGFVCVTMFYTLPWRFHLFSLAIFGFCNSSGKIACPCVISAVFLANLSECDAKTMPDLIFLPQLCQQTSRRSRLSQQLTKGYSIVMIPVSSSTVILPVSMLGSLWTSLGWILEHINMRKPLLPMVQLVRRPTLLRTYTCYGF